MTLDDAAVDRAAGTLLGAAVGDALGAPYEFGSAPLGPDGPQMIGGGLGNFAPGEWTDDTSMTWCVAAVAATGLDLRAEEALTAVGRNFRDWFDTLPADIGIQTRWVLGQAGPAPTAERLTDIASDLHQASGRTAGNGALMRTAPVALAHLDDPAALAVAARRVAALTHADPVAQDSCALWSLAIRHAIVHGDFDLRAGLAHLTAESATQWTNWINEAESSDPNRFSPNGWTVTALQAAWSSIWHTPADSPDHLPATLTRVIAVGDDTDTTAAIAGALLGARWGASALPEQWRADVHGYPGLRGDDLVTLALRTCGG